MLAVALSEKAKERRIFGTEKDLLPLPDLLEVQKNSHEWFFQKDVPQCEREEHGLQELFMEIFPIESYDGSFALEFVGYRRLVVVDNVNPPPNSINSRSQAWLRDMARR